MSITLTFGATALPLSEDFYWSDENAWVPVEQTAQRTVTGALIVSVATRIGGRPVTLVPDDGGGLLSGYTKRATLDTLRAWASVPGREMVLNLRGVNMAVIFRHQDGNAIDATPLVHYSDVDAADNYSATLRFMEL